MFSNIPEELKTRFKPHIFQQEEKALLFVAFYLKFTPELDNISSLGYSRKLVPMKYSLNNTYSGIVIQSFSVNTPF